MSQSTKQHTLFFALTRNYWGTGQSQDEAIKNARDAGAFGRRKTQFSIWQLESDEPIEYRVSGFDGELTYNSDKVTATKLQTSTMVEKAAV